MKNIAKMNVFIPVLALALFSCRLSGHIAGTYHSRFAELFMFGTTLRLKADHSMQYVFQGDLIYDSATGHYQVCGNQVYVEFDKELKDTNKLYYRFDNLPQKYVPCRGNSVPYKLLLYIGHHKLFPAYAETGRKITREKGYSKRRRFLLFGSHYYRKRFYYKKVR